MPRIARIVIPHYLHHVTQRGNRRQKVFFNDEGLRGEWRVESGEWRVESGEDIVHQGSTFNIELFIK